MKVITVLIVGQVRNQHVLMHSVANLVALRSQGIVDRVILATWTEEIQYIRHLLPRLSAAGVTVTSVDAPAAGRFVPGNLMNQMRGVDLALETIEDTDWVLRTRPDLLIDFELVASLAAADMSLDEPDSGAAFAHKIWAPFAELCQPMCISDIIYFGHYSDIMKLQNFDIFHEVAASHLTISPGDTPFKSYDSEVRRYTPPLFRTYPVLYEYYRIYNRFFLGVRELRRAMIAVVYREEFYWQYIAAYFDVLRKYFLIGRDIVKCPVRLIRGEAVFDQTDELLCIDLMQCPYAREVLARDPSMDLTMQLFADGPIYRNTSSEVQAVFNHFERIGIPLAQRLDEAMTYRKDASRIAALQAFHEKLRRVFKVFFLAGPAHWPPPALAWLAPFSQSTINLPS